MSDEITRRMLAAYESNAQPTLFISGFFSSPQANFHTTEEVEFDIIRSDEDVAVAVQDLSVGYRENSDDLYTNKSLAPPIFKESVSLNAFDLLKRMPGDDPFKSPNFRANIVTRMFSKMQKIERKIRRAMELQASQVLQTGIADLVDANGNTIFTVDYKPKATHFVTAGTAWNAGGATISENINDLAEVIRNDGLEDPDQLIMGVDAFEAFIKDPAIQTRYDNRRIDLGTISPMQMRGKGGNFRGIVEIGNYRYDIWTYGGRYKPADGSAKVQFLTPASCIVRASGARLDATFGAIPNFSRLMGGARNLIPELPRRLTSTSGGMDLFTNVWMSNDGEQLFGGVGARPLMIPTAIDTFGNIATGT